MTLEALAKLDDAPLLGEVLDGRYPLVDLIGRGGFGAVYRGLQLPLGRPVAVKLLHAALTSTKDARQRFEREAQALSRLRSPSTVTLFDYGVVAHGPLRNVAYMVMDLIDGESLAVRLRRGPVPRHEAADIIDAVADALGEAHAAGIVHRDLKPDNILLSMSHAGRSQAKVIDFGIARVDDASTTTTGVIQGTPQYMSPEQCSSGLDVPRDGRIDIYALGIVAYEMLVGRRPFEAVHAMPVIMKQLHEPPPGLPGAESDPTLARLTSVIQRAMDKNPRARFASVAEFAEEFRGALAPRSVGGPPAGVLSSRVSGEPGTGSPDARSTDPLGMAEGVASGGAWDPEAPTADAIVVDSLHESHGQATAVEEPARAPDAARCGPWARCSRWRWPPPGGPETMRPPRCRAGSWRRRSPASGQPWALGGCSPRSARRCSVRRLARP